MLHLKTTQPSTFTHVIAQTTSSAKHSPAKRDAAVFLTLTVTHLSRTEVTIIELGNSPLPGGTGGDGNNIPADSAPTVPMAPLVPPPPDSSNNPRDSNDDSNTSEGTVIIVVVVLFILSFLFIVICVCRTRRKGGGWFGVGAAPPGRRGRIIITRVGDNRSDWTARTTRAGWITG
ncbi:hypothetical protein F4808DRAFT_405467 [Astrocystis sublimbata]|nr:hypothetical protein F4808DRAFT_405467 [Astrocystis sublimbata]